MAEKVTNWSRVITTSETTNVDACLRAYYSIKQRGANYIIVDIDICSSTAAPGVSTPNYWSSNGMWVKFNGMSRKLNPYVRQNRQTQYASTQSTSRRANSDYWQRGVKLSAAANATSINISVGLSNYLWAEGNYTFVPLTLNIPVGYTNNKSNGNPVIQGGYRKGSSFTATWKPFIAGTNNSIQSYEVLIDSSADKTNWTTSKFSVGRNTTFTYKIPSTDSPSTYYRMRVRGVGTNGPDQYTGYSNVVQKYGILQKPVLGTDSQGFVNGQINFEISEVSRVNQLPILYGYTLYNDTNIIYDSTLSSKRLYSISLEPYIGKQIRVQPKVKDSLSELVRGDSTSLYVWKNYNSGAVNVLDEENIVNLSLFIDKSDLDGKTSLSYNPKQKENIEIFIKINDSEEIKLQEFQRGLGQTTHIKDFFDLIFNREGLDIRAYEEVIDFKLRVSYELVGVTKADDVEVNFQCESIVLEGTNIQGTEQCGYTLDGRAIISDDIYFSSVQKPYQNIEEQYTFYATNDESYELRVKEKKLSSGNNIAVKLDWKNIPTGLSGLVFVSYYLKSKKRSYLLKEEAALTLNEALVLFCKPVVDSPLITITSKKEINEYRFNFELPKDHAYFLLNMELRNDQGQLFFIEEPFGDDILYDLIKFNYDFAYTFDLKDRTDRNYWIDNLKVFLDAKEKTPALIETIKEQDSVKINNNTKENYYIVFTFKEVYSSTIDKTNLSLELTSKEIKLQLKESMDLRFLPDFPVGAYMDILKK